MAELEGRSIVRKMAGGQNFLGAATTEFGDAFSRCVPSASFVRGQLRDLADVLRLPVFMGILHRDNAVFLLREEGERATFAAHVEAMLPAHATGLGKALLAGTSNAKVRVLLSNMLKQHSGLVALTRNTITSPEELLTDLADVRHWVLCRGARRGYGGPLCHRACHTGRKPP